ncbi:MAG: hypothetical protein ACRERV_15125 [Methylococcales bacterium]
MAGQKNKKISTRHNAKNTRIKIPGLNNPPPCHKTESTEFFSGVTKPLGIGSPLPCNTPKLQGLVDHFKLRPALQESAQRTPKYSRPVKITGRGVTRRRHREKHKTLRLPMWIIFFKATNSINSSQLNF